MFGGFRSPQGDAHDAWTVPTVVREAEHRW